MPLPQNWNSWEWTQKIIKIGHNRSVKRHFKDVKLDDGRSNNREAIKTALLIRDQDSALEVLNKQIYFNRIAQGEIPIATMPEWWPRRVGADVPQLVIVFRPPGKKSSYQISIPHYNGDRNPKIPSFKKGSFRGELTLSDNSKLVVNADSEGEADRVIKILRRYIEPKWSTGKIPIIQRVKGVNFKEIRVVPILADYHSHGQKENIPPTWRKRF